jgi:hypothetical protein
MEPVWLSLLIPCLVVLVMAGRFAWALWAVIKGTKDDAEQVVGLVLLTAVSVGGLIPLGLAILAAVRFFGG